MLSMYVSSSGHDATRRRLKSSSCHLLSFVSYTESISVVITWGNDLIRVCNETLPSFYFVTTTFY